MFFNQIFVAKDVASEDKISPDELWEKISKDEYMTYAVEECYQSVYLILTSILKNEGKMWYVL